MMGHDRAAWARAGAAAQLEAVRAAPPAVQRDVARRYDWDQHPETVLGWIMAQRHVDLATALVVFLAGRPERFNYMAKRTVPADAAARCRLIDNVCQRINCGFYLPAGPADPALHARAGAWLAAQQRDRQQGCRGRWVLEEAILGPSAGPAGHAPRALAERRKVPPRPEIGLGPAPPLA